MCQPPCCAPSEWHPASSLEAPHGYPPTDLPGMTTLRAHLGPGIKKSPIWGMVIPPSIWNPYSGYIHPYTIGLMSLSSGVDGPQHILICCCQSAPSEAYLGSSFQSDNPVVPTALAGPVQSRSSFGGISWAPVCQSQMKVEPGIPYPKNGMSIWWWLEYWVGGSSKNTIL